MSETVDTREVISISLKELEGELRRLPDRTWESAWEKLVSHIGIERLQHADTLAALSSDSGELTPEKGK